MAGKQLDGAGTQKLKTIEEALAQLQRVHGLVERMAVEMKSKQGGSFTAQQVKRAATPMVGLLKGQFGIIADQVSGMLLVAGRGGSEQLKLRALRESVAHIRTALEIAQNKVKEKHMIEEDADAGGA
ncbi:MAG TPA: hypothetical protein VKA84_06630 [Gemmatimonadaceae bacterium]|nr:hypothetical protein [Gemmatimonadaceae bacterium]